MIFSAGAVLIGASASPDMSVSPSWLWKCAPTETKVSCGTRAISTGSAVLTAGEAPSEKCTPMAVAVLPAETAATMFGGNSFVLGAAFVFAAAPAACGSGAESSQAASRQPSANAASNEQRALDPIIRTTLPFIY